MFWIHAFFEAIGILIAIGYLLGLTDLIDFYLHLGPPGTVAKITAALNDKE
jgi:hypothetical protein